MNCENFEVWKIRLCGPQSRRLCLYNPSSNIFHDKYDPTNLNEVEDISEISRLLGNCTRRLTPKL